MPDVGVIELGELVHNDFKLGISDFKSPSAAASVVMGSAVKTAPVSGTIVGIAAMAGLGAAATYAVGKVFARHLAKGGKAGQFDASAVTEELKAEFHAAKGKASA